LAAKKGVFAGGFAISTAQNVVKCVVNRGGFVVKVWWETPSNRLPKNTPTFEIYFFGLSQNERERKNQICVTPEQ
jgi:hypothetical protein